MNIIAKKAAKAVEKVVNKVSGASLSQELTKAEGDRYVTPGMPSLARQCAAEGTVLLRNNGVLPLNPSEPVCIFGRCQMDWFYVGYGSGGDVNPPYRVSFYDAVKSSGYPLDSKIEKLYQGWRSMKSNIPDEGWWGHWPMSYDEMPLEEYMVRSAASKSDTAVVVIGRAAGEDRENQLTEGSYYLTSCERNNLSLITTHFAKTVVVLDCGNIIDMSWAEEIPGIGAIVIPWLGGMESGNALCDVLWGKVNPSGRLPDTIARRYEDYPSSASFGGKQFNEYSEDIFVGYRYFETFAKDDVLWPFGYGLSYTSFDNKCLSFSEKDGVFTCVASVTNTGNMAGSQAVGIYACCPAGELGPASKVLAAFAKTGIISPGESEAVELTFTSRDFSSFDDTGKSGYKNCFVLEKGEYSFILDACCRSENRVYSFTLEETRVLCMCEEICAVRKPFERLRNHCGEKDREPVERSGRDLREVILHRLPAEIRPESGREAKLDDVINGSITLDDFIACLSDEELEALTRGEGTMNSSLGTEGNAGAYGGITASLREKGVPPVITTDGPAGIRLQKFCSLLPCGTALASTWNAPLVNKLYTLVGSEMRHCGTDVLLGPGMNIHRNPLCGRNFEYFSEDPLLTGKMASAVVEGIQQNGVCACPKHFACNNQETNRNMNDSVVSQRALREIYLRGFEICVRQARPRNIMTSYNKINSVWSHYNYDLAETVLRGEWGYDGVVITDWWMKKSRSPEFHDIEDNAYRVRSSVDVLMPGNMSRAASKYKSDGTIAKALSADDGLTRAELQRSARRVLELCLYLAKSK